MIGHPASEVGTARYMDGEDNLIARGAPMNKVFDRPVVGVATCIVLVCAAPTVALHAQSAVHLQLAAAGVNARDSSACQWSATLRNPGPTAKVTPSDTLFIEVFDSATFKTRSVLPLAMEIRVGREIKGSLPAGDTTLKLEAGPAALREAVISIWPAKSTAPVCVAEPLPPVPSFAQPKPFTTRTDIIASGEISNALRTGSTTTPATGTLGFHHQSFPRFGDTLSTFPWYGNHLPRKRGFGWIHSLASFFSYPISGEDLRAVINVASTIDSVTGAAGANFAQSVLAPTTTPSATWKSLDMEYWLFQQYGRHHQVRGFAGRFSASQSRWAPDSSPGKGSLPTRSAVLIAWDVRYRATLINRVSDADDNSLSFTVDGGYIHRSVGGDIKSDPTYVRAALGDTRTNFQGWAFGTYLRLRQVTAFADFQCLSCSFLGMIHGRKGSKIQSLEGLQPLIGFRFEAPFITVPDL
ncbi:MAG TPA: hypothetical protein VF761_03665 [Gemmatimonadaceae bacterium]